MDNRLFAVRISSGELLTDGSGRPQYYDDKQAAKRVRDRHPGAVVVLGPDHNRYVRGA